MPRAAFLYFVLVFAAGALMGTLRVLVVAPVTGALGAVLIELPLMLALSWAALRLVLRLRPVNPALPLRLGMGFLAFCLLMLAEYLLSAVLTGAGIGAFLAALSTPEGAAGLAGQIVFALMPALEGRLPGRR